MMVYTAKILQSSSMMVYYFTANAAVLINDGLHC